MELWLPRSWGACDGQLHASELFRSHCHSNSAQPQAFECGLFGSLGWASHSSWGLHRAHAYINIPSGLQTCRGEMDFPSEWSIWTCPSLLGMFQWTVCLPCSFRKRDKEMSARLALCSQAVCFWDSRSWLWSQGFSDIISFNVGSSPNLPSWCVKRM